MVSLSHLFCFVSTVFSSHRNEQATHKFLSASRLYGVSTSTVDLKAVNIPSEASEITEPAAQTMLNQITFANINVPPYISNTAVSTSYVKIENKSKGKKKALPLVLLHGFDSSCLEFRRLAPLAGEYTDVYVPDILGWGFSNVENVRDFSPNAKLDHLKCFIEQVVGGPCVIVGASLGGAIAINMAASICPELIDKVVLIDAQGFIDGDGPSSLPDVFARLGVRVLKSKPLRQYANYISYADKDFATDDAVRVGRVHCMKDTWEDASVNFLLSGGFTVSPFVSQVQQETLVLWGRQDKILDAQFAERFQQTLPSNELEYLENCGHVPHLEKAIDTAQYIKDFIDA